MMKECEASTSSTAIQDIAETTEAATATESNFTDANEQLLSPEYMQRKLYFLLENLKNFHSELPE